MAAVAAGQVPLTLGSDTNGSIRVPSSLCGVWGLKPTFGRLSRRGSFPFVHSIDHLGPFASDLPGLEIAGEVVALLAGAVDRQFVTVMAVDCPFDVGFAGAYTGVVWGTFGGDGTVNGIFNKPAVVTETAKEEPVVEAADLIPERAQRLRFRGHVARARGLHEPGTRIVRRAARRRQRQADVAPRSDVERSNRAGGQRCRPRFAAGDTKGDCWPPRSSSRSSNPPVRSSYSGFR